MHSDNSVCMSAEMLKIYDACQARALIQSAL